MLTKDQAAYRAALVAPALALRREREFVTALQALLDRFESWTAAERKAAMAEITTNYCSRCGAGKPAGECAPCDEAKRAGRQRRSTD